jgi:hypothetical protein
VNSFPQVQETCVSTYFGWMSAFTVPLSSWPPGRPLVGT